ncbi:MAG: hypothetical protein ACR2G5_06365 [Pyrinomonadaceae bacterium]
MSHTSRAGSLLLLALILFLSYYSAQSSAQSSHSTMPNQEDYLSWTADQSINIGKNWRVNGRVGGALDLRVIHTEHSYNYKLRATLMTPEVVRATARLEQLRLRLTDDQTRELVREAERTDGLVALVEIDAREGSGVIPLNWRSSLRRKGVKEDSPSVIGGTSVPALRHVKALAGVARRDYAYDIFWIVFPMTNNEGKLIWENLPDTIELLVGIYNKEGRVTWPVTDPLRQRLNSLKN